MFSAMSQAARSKSKPGKPPSERPIIVWDTETTGLGPAKNSIVEIGLMELACTTPSKSVYSFSSLVHPAGVKMPGAASRVHGITNPMMQDAPHFAEVWAGVTEYVEQMCTRRGRPILVAHNLGFDLSFLKEELKRIGLPLPDWDFACSLRDVANVVWPGQKASLAALASRFSIVNDEAHRALCDVEATGKVLKQADRELKDNARKAGQRPKNDGEYIREMLENAALKRRGSSQACASNDNSADQPSTSSAKTDSMSAPFSATVGRFYTSPFGFLWHADRNCERLDMANIILRVISHPKDKLPCNKCIASPEPLANFRTEQQLDVRLSSQKQSKRTGDRESYTRPVTRQLTDDFKATPSIVKSDVQRRSSLRMRRKLCENQLSVPISRSK